MYCLQFLSQLWRGVQKNVSFCRDYNWQDSNLVRNLTVLWAYSIETTSFDISHSLALPVFNIQQETNWLYLNNPFTLSVSCMCYHQKFCSDFKISLFKCQSRPPSCLPCPSLLSIWPLKDFRYDDQCLTQVFCHFLYLNSKRWASCQEKQMSWPRMWAHLLNLWVSCL